MVYMVRRTNVYLSDGQLATLRRLAVLRGESAAALIRRAIDEWLEQQGVRDIAEDEWERRFDALLARRSTAAKDLDVRPDEVERDVIEAVREVRRARAARRR